MGGAFQYNGITGNRYKLYLETEEGYGKIWFHVPRCLRAPSTPHVRTVYGLEYVIKPRFALLQPNFADVVVGVVNANWNERVQTLTIASFMAFCKGVGVGLIPKECYLPIDYEARSASIAVLFKAFSTFGTSFDCINFSLCILMLYPQ